MGQRTPLFETHVRLGARMVEFAGWEMPLSYGDPVAEHHAVRRACGLFDVSHMGELRIRGPGAAALCQRMTTNDVRRLGVGDAQYSVTCQADGGIIDDLIVYRLDTEEFVIVANAANAAAVLAAIETQARDAREVAVCDETEAWALVALQGPAAWRAVPVLESTQPRFSARRVDLYGVPVLCSRTGYTGEDGVELFVPAGRAREVWDRLVDAAVGVGGGPAGLAARDTLRLEAALPLCGSDIGIEVTPAQAGLAWAVQFTEGNEFVGRPALEAERAAGVARRLVCFEVEGSGVPRHGYALARGGHRIGVVTSGAKSPTLGRFIGMGYVTSESAEPATAIEVIMRGRSVPARIVRRPFYRRQPTRSA